MWNKLKELFGRSTTTDEYEVACSLQASEFKNETVAHVLLMIKEGNIHGKFGSVN